MSYIELVMFLAIFWLLCAIAIAVVTKSGILGRDAPDTLGEYFGATLTFAGPYCVILLPFACKKLLGKWGDIVELTVWLVVFVVFLVWGAYLEYTLWTKDGIIDRLHASTLSNNEVRGWIFSLNASVILWTGFWCSILGTRIYWLLKSRKRRQEMAQRMWSVLPLWVLIGTVACTMTLEVYFPRSIAAPLVAVVGAILVALTCMMSKSYHEG